MFSVNFEKCLRALFLQNSSGWPLLTVVTYDGNFGFLIGQFNFSNMRRSNHYHIKNIICRLVTLKRIRKTRWSNYFYLQLISVKRENNFTQRVSIVKCFPLHKKCSFPFRISSVNVTKSAGNFSGLNPYSLTNSKNYRLKKSGVFPNIKKLLNRQYTKIQMSQKHYWENFKITDHRS